MEPSEERISTGTTCADLTEIIAAVKMAKADQIQRLLIVITQE